MPLVTDKAPAYASPLWIIALFIALSEVTAGVAAAITNGTARLIFTCFAVVFPTTVFISFVWLLIKHAPKLYAPSQYTNEITPDVYRTGISRVDPALFSRAVAKTVVLGETEDKQESIEFKIDKAARIFEETFEEAMVEIEVPSPGDYDSPIRIPVTNDTQVSDFLDELWFDLADAVQPFTYGKSWVLVDKISGKPYSDIGSAWARRKELKKDVRSLSEVGIKPGSKLTAIIMPDLDSE